MSEQKIRSMNILIAEDNKLISKLYDRVLGNRGHKTVITKNGKECLSVFKTKVESNGRDSSPFDVVLLDYLMPEMNGVEVAKEILTKIPNQRIIFSSAYTEKLIEDLQKNKLNAEIYPKFSTLQSFLNFVEGNPFYTTSK